jgi:hypothetical protein
MKIVMEERKQQRWPQGFVSAQQGDYDLFVKVREQKSQPYVSEIGSRAVLPGKSALTMSL